MIRPNAGFLYGDYGFIWWKVSTENDIRCLQKYPRSLQSEGENRVVLSARLSGVYFRDIFFSSRGCHNHWYWELRIRWAVTSINTQVRHSIDPTRTERQSWTLRVEGSMSRLGDVPSTPTTWKKLEKLFHKLQPNFIDHQSWRKAQIAMNKGGQFGNWHQHARYSAGEMPNLRHAKKQLKKGQRATKIWQEKTHLKNGLKGHSCLLLENGIPRSILK